MRSIQKGYTLSCMRKLQEKTGLSDLEFIESSITTLVNQQGLKRTIENGIIRIGNNKRLYSFNHNKNEISLLEY